jgi:uncharacterized phage infection (PIP) family protein YhgE
VDVQKTIEFILEMQAKHEVRMAKLDQRLDGIAKLIKTGMKVLAGLSESQKDQDGKINILIHSQQQLTESQQQLTEAHQRLATRMEELAEAQRITDQKFQAYLDSLRNGNRN